MSMKVPDATSSTSLSPSKTPPATPQTSKPTGFSESSHLSSLSPDPKPKDSTAPSSPETPAIQRKTYAQDQMNIKEDLADLAYKHGMLSTTIDLLKGSASLDNSLETLWKIRQSEKRSVTGADTSIKETHSDLPAHASTHLSTAQATSVSSAAATPGNSGTASPSTSRTGRMAERSPLPTPSTPVQELGNIQLGTPAAKRERTTRLSEAASPSSPSLKRKPETQG